MNTKPVFHGSDIEKICEYYHLNQEDIVNFGANVNPIGISTHVKQVLASHLDLLSSYPDRDYQSLRNTVSEYCGVPADYVLPGNGSSELISLLIETRAPKRTLLLGPTYSEYSRELSLSNSKCNEFLLKETDEFILNVDFLCQSLLAGSYDFLIICNPNNPTGTVVDSEELKEFIHKVPKDIIIVVDEAYIELSSNPDVKSMVSEISDDTNVVVARTFSKLYGLAGVRLGYAMCNKEMHAILQKCTSVFTGSRVALAGAMAALDDEEYIKKTKAAMLEGRKYLTDEFTKMGFYVYPSETNFLYVNTGYNAAEFAEECKKYGLIIRGNFEYSRITVGRMDQNEKMVGIVKKIIESGELKKI